jgi:hypothetical protein
MRSERPLSNDGGQALRDPRTAEAARAEKELNTTIGSPRGSGRAGRAPRTKEHGERGDRERGWRGASRFCARIIKKDSTDFC